MYGRFVHYTEPAKAPRFVHAATPRGVKWLSPGIGNLDELRSLLKLVKKGILEHYPVGEDVGKVTNDGDYLLSLNIE
jgi:putative SOS response-associated peptidase YedK